MDPRHTRRLHRMISRMSLTNLRSKRIIIHIDGVGLHRLVRFLLNLLESLDLNISDGPLLARLPANSRSILFGELAFLYSSWGFFFRFWRFLRDCVFSDELDVDVVAWFDFLLWTGRGYSCVAWGWGLGTICHRSRVVRCNTSNFELLFHRNSRLLNLLELWTAICQLDDLLLAWEV
jgi:hypothetical protein